VILYPVRNISTSPPDLLAVGEDNSFLYIINLF